MEYSFLHELNNDKDSWMIRVRLCRMWESTNTKKNGELISVDMIFIDEKENLMHATIRKTLVTRFKHMLSEGSLYNVKNLKVVSTTGEYRPLSNQYKIIFLVITSLKRLEEGTVKIPINGFQFVSPNLINLRVNDNTILSDVIGSLCGVGDIEIVGAGWKKRDIKILTDYSVTTKITLWGKLGEMFDPNLYKQDEGPCIVIVTSTTIKKFQGEVNFSTTSASKIYINLQIDYVASLIERFSTVSNVVQVIESSNVNKITFEEEMFLNRMSIEELLEANWSSQVKEYIVTVRGKISEIDNSFGWYKIHIKVMDKTTETTFVLFNHVAEKLLDTSAHKLFNRLPLYSKDVPTEIQSLCGKDFVYKLKLNDYNLKEGLENFTVSKLFTPDEKLELEQELKKDPHDILSNNLEDSVGDFHVTNAGKNRKRKNQIIDDDEVSDGGSNQYTKHV
ncbi:hypothetical protein KPL71_001139 [Citrus sinensis]|uniref:Uncharacterized protein n=1 Tax=Citrus sinensis TaxID=2711 RepID=A0ACB8NUD6_CITSI|nr:hypothetical protein KPL71_001139 [Citrus sinensis]